MINLLPPSIKTERKYGRLNRRLLSYGISVLLVGVLGISIVLFNMNSVQSDEKQLTAEIKGREAEAKKLEDAQVDVEKISSDFKTVDKLYAGEVRFSVLIPQIGALLPPGVVLNALSLTGGKTSPLQLNVNIETQELAAVFQRNLAGSDLFEAVDVGSITTGDVGRYAFSANLQASFKGSAAAKKAAISAATATSAAAAGTK